MLFISKLHISLSQHSQKRHQRDAEAGDDFSPFQFSTVMFPGLPGGTLGPDTPGREGSVFTRTEGVIWRGDHPPRWTGPEPALGFGRVNSAASNDLQESFKEGKKILF